MERGGGGHLRGIVEVGLLDKTACGPVTELMPELLRDKGNERMQQQQGLTQHQILDRKTRRLGGRILQLRFRHLHIPVAKIVPEKTVERLHGRAELKLGEAAVHLPRGGEQPLENGVIVGVEPAGREARENRRERGVVARLPAHLAEPARVPELVAEIFPALDPVFLKADVLPLRRDRHDPEPQAVRPVGVDQVERVGRIAEGLRHLPALLVADDAGEVDVFERNPPLDRLARPHEFEARHDHARDPEENDVRARDERRRRIEMVEALRLHLFPVGPAHRREGPEP